MKIKYEFKKGFLKRKEVIIILGSEKFEKKAYVSYLMNDVD